MADPTPAPPRIEARVESLERLSLAMHARIAEVGQDMQASFRQVADEQLQADRRADARHEELKQAIADSESRILAAFNDLIAVITQKGE